MNGLVVFLGSWQWLRIEAGEVVQRGTGLEELNADAQPVVAVAPAQAVTLFRAELPNLAPAQARAAARLIAAERTAQPLETLHVACGDADEIGGRWVAIADAGQMADWLIALEASRLDADAIVPAPLLLPAPEAGFVRADMGDEAVVRGVALAFVDDPLLTLPLVGNEEVVTLAREAVEAAIMDALVKLPLDLRQGIFARKRGWHVEKRALRRLGILAGALAALSIAVPLVTIVRLNRDSAHMEAQTASLETSELGVGATAAERLAALRGPGAGFAATLRAVRAAVKATPNAEMTDATFANDGTLTIGVRASVPAELETLRVRLISYGFAVESGPASGLGGQSRATLKVRGR